jgi:phage terminase small subunit
MQEAFCLAVVAGKTQSEAFKAAGYAVPEGATDTEIRSKVGTVASNPFVKARIQQLRNKAAGPAVLSASKVLKRWEEIAFADPREIMQYRRVNCRYCRGIDHQYQWVEGVYWEAYATALDACGKGVETAYPNDAGGFGFDGTLEPVDGCPYCFGIGEGIAHFADVRTLVGPARRLYAGVKVTKNGIEVLTHSQERALENIAKHLGMFTENVNLNLGGQRDAAPIVIDTSPEGAAKAYAAMVAAR